MIEKINKIQKILIVMIVVCLILTLVFMFSLEFYKNRLYSTDQDLIENIGVYE